MNFEEKINLEKKSVIFLPMIDLFCYICLKLKKWTLKLLLGDNFEKLEMRVSSRNFNGVIFLQKCDAECVSNGKEKRDRTDTSLKYFPRVNLNFILAVFLVNRNTLSKYKNIVVK